MPRFSRVVLSCATGWLLLATAAVAQEVRPAEELLPATTVWFLATPDYEHLDAQFKKTQIGQLLNDPVMESFTNDLQRQFEQRWASVEEQFGVTLADMREIAGGEIAVAEILPEPGRTARAVVVDVTGKLDKAAALLQRVNTHFTTVRGAKRTLLKVPECEDPVIRFDVPPPKEKPKAGATQTIYCLTGNLLCAANNMEEIRLILARVAARRKDALADSKAFRAVMQRCKADLAGTTPQLRWFMVPVGYFEVSYLNTPEADRPSGKPNYRMLREQGFAGVQGVGGFFDFASEGFEIVYRIGVFAPQPYEMAMKMFVLPNGPDFAPQRWVPRDIAAYTTLYLDLLNAFDNFAPAFEEFMRGPNVDFTVDVKYQKELEAGTFSAALRAEFQKEGLRLGPKVSVTTRRKGFLWEVSDGTGLDGTFNLVRTQRKRDGKKKTILVVYQEVWYDVLEQLRDAPDGPQVDLRKELVAHLGKRVTMLTDYKLPITTTSERLLFAFEVKDVEAVAKAVEKWMAADKTARKHVIDGQIIWELLPDEEIELPKLPVVEIPSLLPLPEEPEDVVEEEQRLFPNASVTVVHGHMFVASHLDFLLKVLEPRDERETLARSIDFRRIDASVAQLGINKRCIRTFSRTDEEFRATYELLRQGKMPEAETMLARLLNNMFGTGKKDEVRKQEIDGSQMPDYDLVRRHLGPAGAVGSDEKDGWFVKGFLLKKE